MGISYSIDTNTGVVRRVVSGRVSTSEVLESLTATLDDPDYRPDMNSLTDVTRVEHTTTPYDVQRIARFMAENRERIRGAKAAVVASADVSFGMVRMLEAFTDELPFEVRAFRDFEQACAWLGIDSRSERDVPC